MNMPDAWIRPGFQFPAEFDTMLFDVDGVLISSKSSFRAAVIGVTEYIVGRLHKINWGQEDGKELLAQEDIEFFKRAGGFNDDNYMTYVLSSLFTARNREWRGTALAERSTAEWAEQARIAQLEGHGGRSWVNETIPASARPDYTLVCNLLLEYYWGADEVRQRLGREPQYFVQAEGVVHKERMLFAPDFFRHLRSSGISHMGMITGRVGPEVDSALERLEAYCGEKWWEVIIPADVHMKPDPQALRAALSAVGARGGLFIGDTADDLDLVLNYRATQQAGEPPVIAAMVVHDDNQQVYQERGADITVSSIASLLSRLSLHGV